MEKREENGQEGEGKLFLVSPHQRGVIGRVKMKPVDTICCVAKTTTTTSRGDASIDVLGPKVYNIQDDVIITGGSVYVVVPG